MVLEMYYNLEIGVNDFSPKMEACQVNIINLLYCSSVDVCIDVQLICG